VGESEAGGLPQRRGWLWIGPLAALAGAAFALSYDSDNGLRAVFRIRDELGRAEARISREWVSRLDHRPLPALPGVPFCELEHNRRLPLVPSVLMPA